MSSIATVSNYSTFLPLLLEGFVDFGVGWLFLGGLVVLLLLLTPYLTPRCSSFPIYTGYVRLLGPSSRDLMSELKCHLVSAPGPTDTVFVPQICLTHRTHKSRKHRL